MTQASQTTIRVLYKEIRDSDVRKLLAQSNDSDTGGGARDIRYRDFDTIRPIITKLFSTPIRKTKIVHTGNLHWIDDKSHKTVSKMAEFWEPTDARPGEGRLAKVHTFACFEPKRMAVAQSEGGRILLLLVQQSDLSVWPYYVSETSLRTNKAWDQKVATAIIDCLDQGGGRNATQGYVDFTNNTRYCNHA